ncbi:MAG: hypothetical protein FWF56_00625 [Firmicutes bacterium]|nr:hypothetical protein [Bacillota bacterium]MCL1953836.1 hypothetical protein [Bacillota bacterium]
MLVNKHDDSEEDAQSYPICPKCLSNENVEEIAFGIMSCDKCGIFEIDKDDKH